MISDHEPRYLLSQNMFCQARTIIDRSEVVECINGYSKAAGSCERTGATRGIFCTALLGSVTSGLVRHAHCPVAVIRNEDPLMPHPAQAPVLVGIDGSLASELATAIAFDEASRRRVNLIALHAWSDTEVFELPGLDWWAVEAEEERLLAEGLAGWQERYPDVTVHRLLVCDRPARVLVETSETAQLSSSEVTGGGVSPACSWVRSATRSFKPSVCR